MKRFLLKTGIALFLLVLLLIYGMFFAYRGRNTNVHAVLDKHELLAKAASPKIIFVGGSSMSFGLDSKTISEALNEPVVNTGTHGGLGLRFMLEDVKPYIKNGDIVVLAPEYGYFYSQKDYYGGITLVMLLIDSYPEGFKYLSNDQLYSLLPDIMKYGVLRLQRLPRSLAEKYILHKEPFVEDIFDRKSFNEYGDAYAHWTKENRPFKPHKPTGKEKVNQEVITDLIAFKKIVEGKGATVVLLPPPYSETSFNNMLPVINQIHKSLNVDSLDVYYDPARYAYPDSLFFDFPYHLNKKGVDLRTSDLIEDLSELKNGR